MDGASLKKIYTDVNRRSPFIVHNHIELEEIEPGRALLRLKICDDSRNIYGLVHGGAIYAMADNAAGCAASTDGRRYVTQAGNMRFIGNMAEGEIFAEAKVSHRGRVLTLIDVFVRGADGRQIAEGDFTYFCVNASEDGNER